MINLCPLRLFAESRVADVGVGVGVGEVVFRR